VTVVRAAALRDEVAKTPLAARFERQAAAFLERHATLELAPDVARGLARLLAASAEAASFLARRSALVQRLAALDAGFLGRRARELEVLAQAAAAPDLEAFLDELRLVRREETLLAACLDLADGVPFEAVSAFLSILAETLTARALSMAESRAAGPAPCVVAMGKLAGREFTYHSDLDLVFLHSGPAAELPAVSRVGQRLVSQLTTMTGAGVAYAVDARLRPSGHQGALVTTFEGFEAYQLEQAQTWEHLALLRSRVIAGDVARGQARLERLRDALLTRGAEPWEYVADLRRRVHAERGREARGRLAFKTGPGGIMDVEFLACAGMLERGSSGARAADASIPSLLRAAAPEGAAEGILTAYRWLRRVEARVRLVAGRAVEHLGSEPETLAVVAELVEPGAAADGFLERMASVRREVEAACRRVIAARTICALGT
jgi:glutamate-ammonia-ligase adenylyltransferase